MERDRALFVDNVRLTMIVLVVCIHASVTYSGVGGWYYKEAPFPQGLAWLSMTVFEAFCQSFFMGALFALAGYFAALSLHAKGPAEFVRARVVRLGLPTLFFMLVVNPATVYWLIIPGDVQSRLSLAGFFQDYLLSGRVLSGTGPMWFALALLVFCLIYAGLSAAGGPRPAPAGKRPFTAKTAAGMFLVIAAGAFSIRLVQPIGTAVLNMQLCFFASYVVLFVFGVKAFANDWLRTIDYRLGRYCLLASLAAFPLMVWLFASIGDQGMPLVSGGGTWQSLAYAIWESFNGVCMTVGMIAVAREKWNTQGRLAAAMSEGAFAVYVFHTPVVVALAKLMISLRWPAPAKFLVLSALSLVASFVLARLVRRVPVLRDLVRQ